jgi:CheY-like chemotaxis protein
LSASAFFVGLGGQCSYRRKKKMNAQILVVDDEVDFCSNVADILGNLGYQAEVAYRGADAIECSKRRAHDLFLLDYRLPCMTGAKLYTRLKETRASTPAILVTAYASSDAVEEADAAGIGDVLEKPVDFGELISVIQRRLVRHRPMTFQEAYPNAFAHFTTVDGFMKSSAPPDECVRCEMPATWFHKALGLYFCSRECHEGYEAAERRRLAGSARIWN